MGVEHSSEENDEGKFNTNEDRHMEVRPLSEYEEIKFNPNDEIKYIMDIFLRNMGVYRDNRTLGYVNALKELKKSPHLYENMEPKEFYYFIMDILNIIESEEKMQIIDVNTPYTTVEKCMWGYGIEFSYFVFFWKLYHDMDHVLMYTLQRGALTDYLMQFFDFDDPDCFYKYEIALTLDEFIADLLQEDDEIILQEEYYPQLNIMLDYDRMFYAATEIGLIIGNDDTSDINKIKKIVKMLIEHGWNPYLASPHFGCYIPVIDEIRKNNNEVANMIVEEYENYHNALNVLDENLDQDVKSLVLKHLFNE